MLIDNPTVRMRTLRASILDAFSLASINVLTL